MRRSFLLSSVAAISITGAAVVFSTQRRPDAPTPELADAPARIDQSSRPEAPPSLASADTANEVTRLLAELAREPDRNDLAQRAFAGLVAALERDATGALAVLEPMLAEVDGRAVVARIAIGAMAQVGTPEIQAALMGVVVARADDERFATTALPSLGLIAKPTVETEAALGTLARSGSETTRGTAHLSLGIMASKLADGDARRSRAIVAEYEARLATATSVEERRRWLGVLGNAGTPAAATVVIGLLEDPDPAIRGRAVEALRRVASAEAEALQFRALGDRDSNVRASAAWSLAYRNLSPARLRAMLDRLAIETDDRAGTAMLDTIWSRKNADGTVAEAVREIAERHASQVIRARARRYIAQG